MIISWFRKEKGMVTYLGFNTLIHNLKFQMVSLSIISRHLFVLQGNRVTLNEVPHQMSSFLCMVGFSSFKSPQSVL